MIDLTTKCVECGQDFAVIPLEQTLLEKLKLPLPKKCHFCRKRERHHVRQRGRFYKVKCKKCEKEIYTTCDPATELQIYCKECYLAFKGSGESEKIFLESN